MRVLNIILAVLFQNEKYKGRTDSTALLISRTQTTLLLFGYTILLLTFIEDGVGMINIKTSSNQSLFVFIVVACLYCFLYFFAWNLQDINDYIEKNEDFVDKLMKWIIPFYLINIFIIFYIASYFQEIDFLLAD